MYPIFVYRNTIHYKGQQNWFWEHKVSPEALQKFAKKKPSIQVVLIPIKIQLEI